MLGLGGKGNTALMRAIIEWSKQVEEREMEIALISSNPKLYQDTLFSGQLQPAWFEPRNGFSKLYYSL